MTECPDETTLSDFLAGLLSEENRAAVLAHVEGCSSCQWVLAAGKGPPSSPEASAEKPSSPELARGSTLSRYVVLERIGSGAMGVVYAAYDPELDRQVALKVLRPEGRHEEALQRRLLLEAQALARLSHANVVSVHDVGMHGDGIFLAMELVEGSTLAEWMKQPHPWAEVLRVFREAGKGLAAAHAAGLVHRDFKPANVLVGQEGRVWVTDFGLARPMNREDGPAPQPALEVALSLDSPLTLTGALVGTPVYMAPELVQGRRADARSDQFSFCVTLYEALFGVRPFEGNSLEALARAAAEGKLQPPRRNAKAPAWVRRAVLRGLRPRPEERFSSMEALLTALSPSPSPRRRRVRVIFTAVAACLLGVIGAYLVAGRRAARCAQEGDKLAAAWGAERRERVHAAFLATGIPYAANAWERLAAALDAHASQWRALRTEACLEAGSDSSDAAWQTAACLDSRLWQLAAVTEVLEKADAQTVQNAQQLTASLEGLSECREAPGLSTRPQPPEALRPRVDEARRKLAHAEAQLTAGRYSEALALTSALLGELQGLDYRPLEAEVLLTHGQLHARTGKPKEAEELLYKALWAAESGRDDESVARAWVLLLWVTGEELAHAADVERITQHAQASVERLGRERFPAITMDLHLRLSSVMVQQGKLDRAEAEATQGLELARRVSGPDPLRTALFLQQLGRVRYRQDRFEEALALHREGLELRERILGTQHPDLVGALNSMALDYAALDRINEAIDTWHRALALQETSQAPEHKALALPLHNLGMNLRVLGRLEEAQQTLERSHALFVKSYGPDHPLSASGLSELALVALDMGRLDEAVVLCDQALEHFRRSLGPDSPRLAAPLRYRARIHIRAGRYAEARRDVLDAMKLLEKEYGQDSVKLSPALSLLADVATGSGNPREAVGYCQRAQELDEKAQGPESLAVASDLVCLGEAQLALGAPEKAAPPLERARKLYARSPGEPMGSAWDAFLLARALVEQRSAQDRARAASLAEEARLQFERLGSKARPELQKVQAWQRREAVR